MKYAKQRFQGLSRYARHCLAAALCLSPLAALATDYPLTVKDMDNRTVVINHEPERIILQDGRDIMALALLDRDNPFARVVTWNNLIKKQDSQEWAVLSKTWPDAARIPDMGLSDQGNVNPETVLSTHPDLLVAQLRAKPALEQTGVLKRFRELHIPVIFLDYELHPMQDTVPSITLLGKVLNKEQNAKAYTDFYTRRLDQINQVVSKQQKKPSVFIEPIAGNSDNCCFTHGKAGWGELVAAAGGINIGSELLTGASGFINPEQIITMRPDWYLMTGSRRGAPGNPVLPFGYNTSVPAIQASFDALLHRTAVANIPAVSEGHVGGIYHHFYNHPWNIIGVETLAHWFYPQQFASLNPTADYHYIATHFTKLPDDPVNLSYRPEK
ncbi:MULTISPECIES: ABC transporter substrate-binding protein [Tatumella]|uniref:ABC transporter substrate-binding protein n=1 Tax=Tatumella punctata TaxID=399969 RepID=A0ABW1VNE9_9GAMM|nr:MULTISPECIES: ABC transporter substrate-binding protein [unclassified Tatumella]MBS0856190.1 ABC transporter substrate-binding protein [Tatumella sp. JGM16]MBS0877544.1 ABC transporter substrate-binding protein [Tatumella sp. JGM82]MBS0891103.1 ABC transporter substrate-binding protein [Tatumella sp. JGM94]MBS0893983.1 ABC transporter substrate-binding protein [Tatumella sp. JGM130]MBS0902076.1 ABC transporter substrate-binding protein [Tatumella sp. JGM100]